jgi:integrase
MGRTTKTEATGAKETKSRRGRDEGAIIEYRRDDSGKVILWSGQVTLPYRPDGKRNRKTVYGKTKSEVREKITRIKGEIALGIFGMTEELAPPVVPAPAPTPETPTEHTVAEAVTRWLETAVQPKLRPTTYRSYEQMTRVHVLPILGKYPLSRVDAGIVDDFLAERQETLSPQSVHYLRSILRRVWRYAMKWKWTGENPVLLSDPISVGHGTALEVSQEKALALLEAFRGHPYECAYTIAIGLGMRIGEVLGLCWKDVHLNAAGDGGWLAVSNQLQRIGGEYRLTPPKTTTGARKVPLPAFVAHALAARKVAQAEERRRAGDGWHDDFGLVFTRERGEPFVYRTVYERFRILLSEKGLGSLRLHDLRHICVSLLFAAGVPDKVVAEIIGHSDPNFSKRRYAHVLPSAREGAAQAMDRAFDGRAFHFGSKDLLPEMAASEN